MVLLSQIPSTLVIRCVMLRKTCREYIFFFFVGLDNFTYIPCLILDLVRERLILRVCGVYGILSPVPFYF